MELAVVTNTGPDDWRDQSDETLATALDVLSKRAEAEKQALRKSRAGRRG